MRAGLAEMLTCQQRTRLAGPRAGRGGAVRTLAIMSAVIWLAVIWLAVVSTAVAEPLLPDLFSWESVPLEYMHGGTLDLVSEPGRVLYRFNVAIPNIGVGPFEVFEITHPDATQDVYQNIHDSDGGVTQVLMASFSDVHPTFGHLHLEALAQYNLREVTSGGGVGDTVALQSKTSHGLVDSVSYDTSLPGAPATRFYNSVAANPLGVSVGWADLYSKSIPTQRIDVTDVPSGAYWLEVSIDPNNMVEETNETNNITRILVDLEIPRVPEPGAAVLFLGGAALASLTRRRIGKSQTR